MEHCNLNHERTNIQHSSISHLNLPTSIIWAWTSKGIVLTHLKSCLESVEAFERFSTYKSLRSLKVEKTFSGEERWANQSKLLLCWCTCCKIMASKQSLSDFLVANWSLISVNWSKHTDSLLKRFPSKTIMYYCMGYLFQDP